MFFGHSVLTSLYLFVCLFVSLIVCLFVYYRCAPPTHTHTFTQAQQEGAQDERLTLPMEDGFARLLLHGLADFYGLGSSSKVHGGGGTHVVVSCRPSTQAGWPEILASDILSTGAELGLGLGDLNPALLQSYVYGSVHSDNP